MCDIEHVESISDAVLAGFDLAPKYGLDLFESFYNDLPLRVRRMLKFHNILKNIIEEHEEDIIDFMQDALEDEDWDGLSYEGRHAPVISDNEKNVVHELILVVANFKWHLLGRQAVIDVMKRRIALTQG
jgi:hypothetical protein